MALENRVNALEKLVAELQVEVKQLKVSMGNTPEERDWKRNVVSDYMIKVFYPGIYCEGKEPTSGFPKNRKKTVEQISPGQYMFAYLTSPVKKVIGLTRVTSSMKEVEGQWPYSVDLEWVIGPKQGFTFKELGLEIRPRVGDTLYGLVDDKAQEIIKILKEQPDLEVQTLNFLASEYAHLYKGKQKQWT